MTDDTFSHRPLPYEVVLRVVVDEDGSPQPTINWNGYAYSVMEAMMQAMMEAGRTSVSEGKYNVVSIRPDVGKFMEDLARELSRAGKG